jgi:hypothetical protein
MVLTAQVEKAQMRHSLANPASRFERAGIAPYQSAVARPYSSTQPVLLGSRVASSAGLFALPDALELEWERFATRPLKSRAVGPLAPAALEQATDREQEWWSGILASDQISAYLVMPRVVQPQVLVR